MKSIELYSSETVLAKKTGGPIHGLMRPRPLDEIRIDLLDEIDALTRNCCFKHFFDSTSIDKTFERIQLVEVLLLIRFTEDNGEKNTKEYNK
jgi:hypothetical protein